MTTSFYIEKKFKRTYRRVSEAIPGRGRRGLRPCQILTSFNLDKFNPNLIHFCW